MANNVQTAEQWQQVFDNTQADWDRVSQTQSTATNQERAAARNELALRQALDTDKSPEAYAKWQESVTELQNAKSFLAITTEELTSLRQTRQNARQQIALAQSGPPNNNSTVQPAGASPNANSEGSNTDVIVTPVPEQTQNTSTITTVGEGSDPGVQNEDGAAEGGNTAANAAALRTPPTVGSSEVAGFNGTPYDDEGNLNPGWTLDENNDPVFVGGDFVEPSTLQSAQASRLEQAERTAQKTTPPPPAPKDWRVRISLAKGSNYLYNYGDSSLRDAGILEPLRDTGGVIFPYTPTISVAYNAKYDTQTITHSNYNIHNYTGSSVDQVSISGDFTAQDSSEAAYMLAVIHFFRSATKMFYGKDENPTRGTPPPLLYLSGHGNYQFDNHPMVLTNFAYSLPVDVDYINAYPDGSDSINSIPLAPFQQPNTAKPSLLASGIQRLIGSGLQPGGMCKRPVFQNRPSGADVVTRVPTKITISLTFLPVVTRNAITNHFSLKNYATGKLLRGSQNPGTGGGIW